MLESRYSALDTLFTLRILFFMMAVEFDRTCSKSCMRLLRVNVILCSWLPVMLERKYTIPDTLFSLGILFLMIALEAGCITSKYCMRLFRVTVTLCSWMLSSCKGYISRVTHCFQSGDYCR